MNRQPWLDAEHEEIELNKTIDEANAYFQKKVKAQWKENKIKDMVKAPQHYADRKYQTILVLQDTLSTEEFLGFLKGNAMKYLSRAGKKDAQLQELNKAKVYLQWAIELEEHGELQDVPVY